MSKYSLTNKGNVIQCKWNCESKHDHYFGNYEGAIKYFGLDTSEIKTYGKLINIIIFHQTSDCTVRKFSNELYDILMHAMSQHKYFIEQANRHDEAMEILDQAKKMNLILDDELSQKINDNSKYNSQRRKYIFQEWCKRNDY